MHRFPFMISRRPPIRSALTCGLAIVAAVLSANPLWAGQFNRVLDIGDAAPAWQELIGVDDKQHSLADLAEAKAVVVGFTCNSCPYSVDVEERLVALHEQYAAQGVAVVAINVNKVPEDLLPAMKEKAEAKSFRFPYLFDETQQIARDYGATYTPEFYVLDGQRRIAYMGALDDSPDGKSVDQRYVAAAIDAVLQGGQPEVTETAPIGCRVRYERVRRSRRNNSAAGR